MNIIHFTSLGIVKCKEFELTNELFLGKMINLIKDDPNRFNVTYDSENDEYHIRYDHLSYDVEFVNEKLNSNCPKKEVIDLLNKLVEITNNTYKLRSEEMKRVAYKVNRKEELFKKAESGIVETNEEKRAKLAWLKEEYKKNNKGFFKSVWDTFISVFIGKTPVFYCVGLCILSIIGLIVGMACISVPVGFFTFIPLGIDSIITVPASVDGKGYRGVLLTIISVLLLPVNLLYNIGKKITNRIKYIIKIIKTKSTITKVKEKKEFISKSNINIKQVDKFLDEVGFSNLKNGPTDLETTVAVVSNLKEKILLIKDEKISKQYAMELFEIIKYYVDASINLNEKDRIPTILTSQITDLNKRVDEILSKEKEQETVNSSCDNLVEYIEHQKSIGTR